MFQCGEKCNARRKIYQRMGQIKESFQPNYSETSINDENPKCACSLHALQFSSDQCNGVAQCSAGQCSAIMWLCSPHVVVKGSSLQCSSSSILKFNFSLCPITKFTYSHSAPSNVFLIAHLYEEHIVKCTFSIQYFVNLLKDCFDHKMF